MHYYSAVLFDLDDTLIDFKKSEEKSLHSCYNHSYAEITNYEDFVSSYRKINLHLWKNAELGIITSAEIGKERFRQLADHYCIPFDHEIPRYYEQQLILNSVWVEGAPDLLQSLKEKNIKIGFITNGFSHVQWAKYKNFNLADYSEILVISEEVGVAKPNPEIFYHALRHMGTPKDQTLVVGDSLTSDGNGARAAGFPFCWFNPAHTQPQGWTPDHTISSLHHLLPHFERKKD